MERLPNWLRYILAFPFGILCLYICYYIGYFSNRFIASPDSLLIIIYNFLYRNGINVLVMMAGMNYMLPKYQFKFTLIVSIIFCSIGMIGLGMSIIMQTVTILYIIEIILTFVAFIYSCCVAFKYDVNNNEIHIKDYEVEVIEDISNAEKAKYIKLSNIVMKALDVFTVEEALSKTCEFYKENGIDLSNMNLNGDNKYEVLSRIIMRAMGTDDIDDAIDKTISFYKEQGIEV